MNMKLRQNGLAMLMIACAMLMATTVSAVTFQVDLDYNFNGIVHLGEDGMPDDPDGYRSISDRGLNFSGGLPSDATVDKYNLVDAPGVLDIVHLGNRNTVTANPANPFAFDAAPDGDEVGIQPTWLPNPDQTGTQTTVLGTPILLDGSSAASFLFQISDGGGNFDVRFGFSSGGDVVATIMNGPDWFGGPYAGTDQVDIGNLFGAGLNITEGVIGLSAEAGRTLTSIGFENRSNTDAGYAILAGNVEGVPEPSTGMLLLIGLAVCCRRKV